MSTEIAKQAEKPLVAMLAKYQGQIEAVLPKHMTPTRVLKMIVGAINKTPALLNCTPMSVINAVLTASMLGLEIGPGQAYLVPFGKECTLLIDYRGKIDLAIRSGKVTDIDLEVVYSREKFRIYRDETGTKRIEHEPMYYRIGENGEHFPITEKDRGVPIGAYAFAVMKEGPPKIVFMPAIDIDAIRNKSRQKDGAPWKDNTMEMWKKTVAHRICKTLPMSAEKADSLRTSQEVDDRFETGDSLDQIITPDPEDEVPMLSGAGQGSVQAAIASAASVEKIGEKLAAAAQPTPAPQGAAGTVLQMPSPTPEKAPWSSRPELHKYLQGISGEIGAQEFKRILDEAGIEYIKLRYDDDKTLQIYRVMEKYRDEKKAASAQATPVAEEKPLF